MKACFNYGSLTESDTNLSQKVIIEELLKDHDTVSTDLREIITSIEEDIDNKRTADFLTVL
ncbi:hypothetical protein [Yeosuana sp.]|uniref:hypothetical protein n=1 Tax=Yeosuana sp. TaxID=2529388 RepID=UPI0040551C1E|tara:strand:- start:957 stop:1139 length:183 start_codon:yes stop_codon:yes gene_type:complete